MSLAAQVLSQVRGLIEEVSTVLHRKDAEQDERLNALEGRITALEGSAPDVPEAAEAPAKRGPGRPRKTVAQAGTAEGTGKASST